MTTQNPNSWGGARPGAGRKPKKDKRVQVTAYVTRRTADIIASIKGEQPLGRIVDKIAENWPAVKKVIDLPK